jgi:two-component system, OmpR family, response regulator
MKHFQILIVDDEKRYADMLAKRLGLRGLNCSVRYDGGQAIEAVSQDAFQLVILDLQLPDLYGVEVLTRIKKSHPETAVIILTGHGTEKDKQRCLSQGAHRFLNKPVEIDQLVAIITTIKESSV